MSAQRNRLQRGVWRRLRTPSAMLVAGLLAALFLETLCAAAEAGESSRYVIKVTKHDNMLRAFKDGRLIRRYPVATGKYECTVTGTFRVTDKRVVSERGNGDLGSHWLGLNTQGRRHIMQVGIHGTNEPELIGTYVSKGCVRLNNADIRELYGMIPIGARVEISDDSDDTFRHAAGSEPPSAEASGGGECKPPESDLPPDPPPTASPAADTSAAAVVDEAPAQPAGETLASRARLAAPGLLVAVGMAIVTRRRRSRGQ